MNNKSWRKQTTSILDNMINKKKISGILRNFKSFRNIIGVWNKNRRVLSLFEFLGVLEVL
jgi:hypothetical protein